MRHVVPVVLFLVGLILAAPVLGVLGVERLQALYGVTVAGPDMAILMRHRALMLGVLGVFSLVAAFRPRLRFAALITGLVSIGGFLALAMATGGYNAEVAKVVMIDWIALGLLAAGLVAWVSSPAARHIPKRTFS
jgi:hypothetical protein